MSDRIPPPTEAEVTRQVLDAAQACGLTLERRNVGGRHDASGRYVPFGQAGDPDWEATIPTGPNYGVRLYVEIKAPGKKPRKNQLDTLVRRNAEGSIAFWIDDGAQAFHVFERINAGWRVKVWPDASQELLSPGEPEPAEPLSPVPQAETPRRKIARKKAVRP